MVEFEENQNVVELTDEEWYLKKRGILLLYCLEAQALGFDVDIEENELKCKFVHPAGIALIFKEPEGVQIVIEARISTCIAGTDNEYRYLNDFANFLELANSFMKFNVFVFRTKKKREEINVEKNAGTDNEKNE